MEDHSTMDEFGEHQYLAWDGLCRGFVAGLLESCPYSKVNPQSCQLAERRRWEKRERIEWLMGLSEEQCRDITISHLTCSLAR